MRRMQGAAGAVSFVVAFLVAQVLLSRFGRLALDQPNERSLHERPVPRTGGIAVLAGAATSLAFGAHGAGAAPGARSGARGRFLRR